MFGRCAPVPVRLLSSSGRVVDGQGRAVAEANVRLMRQLDSWRTSTDAEGAFAFDRVTAGEFVIEVEKDQFRHESRVVVLTPGMAAADN